jgi:DNA-binding transcriptional MerR regulator
MRVVKIGKVADLLGVSIQTLYNWERIGELVPDRKIQERLVLIH